MSAEAIRIAWERIRESMLPPTRRLVLLALADRHNAKTGQCNPSFDRLIQDTGLDRHTLPSAIRELEAGGFISVQRRNGAGSRYQITSAENHTSALFRQNQCAFPHSNQEEPRAIHTLGATEKTVQQEPSTPVQQDSAPAAKPKPRKSTKTPLPENFAASAQVREWYTRQGFTESIADHVEAFCDKVAARGYEYANWDAALKTAIRDDWAGLRTKKIPAAVRPAPGISANHMGSRHVTEKQRNRQRNDDVIASLARGENTCSASFPQDAGGVPEPLDALDGEFRVIGGGIR